MISEEDGRFLVKIAREAIEKYVSNRKRMRVPEKVPEELKNKQGIFVTIYKKVGKFKELRGCIGYPYPTHPLIEACIDSAVAACMDPRFFPLRKEELKDIIVEVSVLSEPELLEVNNPKEYLKKVKIGRDGLILKKGIMSGLLLPQVPVEQGWSVEEFLNNLCLKAGLGANCWLDPATEIYRFEAQIFEEKNKKGKLVH